MTVMGRVTVTAAFLAVLPSCQLAALQCPDGSPPPCRGARAAPSAPAFSVAVLSFENRSRDSADTFLGDGLADEIATQLGGVQKLTVRSRTMVRRLAGAGTMAPPALGRALGAAYLVDGSIQRAGTQLRVQVILLRSASGDQAWAQTYDRPAADLFQIQSDIARSVSEAIAGRLLPQERASLARAPTRNAEAYQLYLRARAVGFGSRNGDALALASLERAVAMDSTFAEAWAQLSRQRMWMWWASIDRSPANLAAAFGAAQRARRLAPDGVVSYLAMGYYYYWGSRDYARALEELNAALRLRPNDADTWDAMANISRRQGQWDASVEQRRRAVTLEPADPQHWVDLSTTLWSLRRYAEALAAADSASRLFADSLVVEEIRGGILYVSQGIEAARPHYHRVFAIQGTTLSFSQIPLLSGAYRGDSVFWAWADRLGRPASGAPLYAWYDARHDRWRGAGDSVRAAAYGDSLRLMSEQFVAEDSTNVEFRLGLAVLYSYAGRHADALRESERGVRDMPRSLDDYSGSLALLARAFVLAHAGRTDEAVAILEQILPLPTGHAISTLMLRTEPDWAVLRGNARFERLIN